MARGSSHGTEREAEAEVEAHGRRGEDGEEEAEKVEKDGQAEAAFDTAGFAGRAEPDNPSKYILDYDLSYLHAILIMSFELLRVFELHHSLVA